MRISPNQPRLRLVALGCWAIGAFSIVYGSPFLHANPILIAFTISAQLLGIILLAIGISFWLISADRRAGVVFDAKGLLLNLGNSSSFIAWDNIERVGVSGHRTHMLSLGSPQLFGVALKDRARYVQSYEERLPAAKGLIARGISQLASMLKPFRRVDDRPLMAQLAQNRTKTGYDVLIPEAFLGGRADAFVQIVEVYRSQK